MNLPIKWARVPERFPGPWVGIMSGLIDLGEYLEKFLSPRSIGYEVGSFAGESMEVLAKYFDVFHCVDLFNDACEYPNLPDVEASFDIRAKAAGNVIKHVTTSREQAILTPNGTADFVYIDACHLYEYVIEDIRYWLPKVRAGGIISGHDFIVNTPDVVRAVKEVFGEPDFVFADTSWIVRVP